MADDTTTSPLDGIEAEELLATQLVVMPEKYRRFILAYLRTNSVTRAYREAGFEGEQASTGGMRLMKDPRVSSIIHARQQERLRRLQVTPERIEEEIAKVAFATLGAIMRVQEDGSAYLDFSEADADTLAGLQSFKCELVQSPGDDPDQPRSVLKMEAKMWPKIEALGKLAQIRKMITGDQQVSVTIDVADEIRRKRRERAGLEPAPAEGDK